MLARLDHRPMLTAVLGLTTTVLVVVVITLATLLITSAPPAVSPPSTGDGNPGVAPANMDAGGENYGWPNNTKPAQPAQHSQMSDGERHAEIVRNAMH
jgi:hypothetical protein